MATWKLVRGPAVLFVSLLTLGCAALPRTGPPALPEARSEPEATGAGEALAWRRLAWVDEHGDIAPGALEKALRQRRANMALWQARGLSRVAGIARGQWVHRGPQNIGGRTRALLIDPTSPQHMWAASVSGGLWKSENGGNSWVPVDDFLPRLSVNSLAMDPANSSILYAGTGEGFFNVDSIYGEGILKSVDGGATWTQLSATRNWMAVNRIAVSPWDSRTLLAAVRYRVAASDTRPSEGGIFRSLDGGETWTEVKATSAGFFVAFDPNQQGRAVASVMDRGDVHKAFYSEDSGATWQAASGLPIYSSAYSTRIELAYAPSTAGMVYALLSGAIWRSTDSGRSYVQMTVSGNNAGSDWYRAALWVSPVDAGILVAGGVHLFRSTDSGRTLEQISDSFGPYGQPHADQHCIVSAPGFDGVENRRVYVCTDGGVFRTEDIYRASPSRSWTSLNTGYETTQFYGAAGDGPSGLIVGGTQDNGTITLTQGSDQGTFMYGGDGGFSAIDWEDPRYCYGENYYLLIVRSVDGGRTSQLISMPGEAYFAANFIAPFILDPNEPRRMLAGASSLWKTEDAREDQSWHDLQPPQAASSSSISAIAVAPGHSNIVWIARNGGEVFKTTNGLAAAPSWETIDNSLVGRLPNRYPTRILIDRENPDRVYIAFGGFTDGNLMRTLDGGKTWTDATGSGQTGLPEAPIRGIAQHPRHADWIYAGTEVGVFASEDGGQHWSAVNQGPANVSVDELVFMHNSSVLLAATYGRGIWTVDTDAALPPGCIPDSHTLCLNQDRFKIEVDWTTAANRSGQGTGVRLTSDTGYFWFFDPANVEMLVKVLDGCTLNHKYWVFVGGLTDVGVDIRVTDTKTGAEKTYRNVRGTAFAPIQDTSAFDTCP